MTSLLDRPFKAVSGALILAVLMIVIGCSDDPILGPDDGSSSGGGSYGVIQRLAPADTAQVDSTRGPSADQSPNPETF